MYVATLQWKLHLVKRYWKWFCETPVLNTK